MPFFARFHSFHGHGGSPPPDIITIDAHGHAIYHLGAILLYIGMLVVSVFVLYSVIFKPDYSRSTTPGGCLAGACLVLVVIAITCAVLLHFPAFAW